jgi:Kef-type K+ transport system membrane component KefB
MVVPTPLAFLNFHGPAGPPWQFLVVILVIIIGPFVAERLRLPGIIGLLVGGLIIGPHVLAIIPASDTTFNALGNFGLLYLMFLAGLELDLEMFRRNRTAAITFALLTFTLPMLGGTTAGLSLGFAVPAALLLGSLLASHTLVTYPTARRYGLAGNLAVTTSVGATVITDTLSLAVLAGVSGASTGEATGLELAAQLVVGLGALGVWCFLVLPRVGRWFFRSMGQERTLRFVFVMATFLSGAVLAEMMGIDGIVGAFFAGLGLNRLVPNAGALMDRIGFFGSALFIPLFLVSVGFIIDPAVMVEAQTLGYAAAFLLACLSGKAVAAGLTKPLFHFSWDEVLMVYGLSTAQAAATLAATIVGFQIGLFGETVVNAVLWLIVVTLIVSSLATNRAARRMEPAAEAADRLGRIVVLPLLRLDHLAPVAGLASRLATADGGIVVPVRVSVDADSDHRDDEKLIATASAEMRRIGMDVDVVFRVDTSIESGIAHACRSEKASLLLLDAEPIDPAALTRAAQLVFGTLPEQIAAVSPVPVLLLRTSETPVERVVLALSARDFAGSDRSAALAVELLTRLRRSGLTTTVLAPSKAALAPLLAGQHNVEVVASDLALSRARSMAREGTLVIFAARPGRAVAGLDADRLGALPGVSVAVVMVAGASLSVAGSIDQSMKLVVGRSDSAPAVQLEEAAGL